MNTKANFSYLFRIFLLVLFTSQIAYAQQIPQGFNYQAVARDNDGKIIANKEITVEVSVRPGTPSSFPLWQEGHSVRTNELGVFTLVIGEGITTGVGTEASFEAIDWSADDHYISIRVDFDDGLLDMGTFKLQSVPYAMVARDVINIDDADADPQNELQDLELNGNILQVTKAISPTPIDLSVYLDNTDQQALSFSSDTLYLQNGGQIYLGDYWDNTDNQNLSFMNDTLYLQNGGNIYLGAYWDNTDNQSLSLLNDTLYLFNGGQVSLSPYLDNTDNQILSFSSDTLYLQNGGSIYLGAYYDNTDNQTLNFSSDTLYLQNGGNIYLGDYYDNTDNQALTLANDTLNLTNGGFVNLNPYMDNTDNQTLTFSNDTLTISGGNNLVLPYDSSLWTLSGNDIYYEAGKVGIGTSNPGAYQLNVNGNIYVGVTETTADIDFERNRIATQITQTTANSQASGLYLTTNAADDNTARLRGFLSEASGYGSDVMGISASGFYEGSNTTVGLTMPVITGVTAFGRQKGASGDPAIATRSFGLWAAGGDQNKGSNYGALGVAGKGLTSNIGVLGAADDDLDAAFQGQLYTLSGGTNGVGVYGYNPNAGGYAGYFDGNLKLTGILFDENDSAGNTGQILSATGTGIKWLDYYDGDTSSSNELQDLTFSNDTLYISDGNNVVISSSTHWTKNVNDIFYNAGKVGIGVTAPTAELHIDGNDGFVVEGTHGTGALAVDGAGTRLLWYPGKSAFRVGTVAGTYWDDAFIGSYSSVSGGYNNRATGDYSNVSGGLDNEASGVNSFIGGGATNVASGIDAVVAGGLRNIASGNYSNVTGGLRNEASGITSTVAGGAGNLASGQSSFIGGGDSSNASAMFAATIGGVELEAQSYASLVIGRFNQKIGDPLSWNPTDPVFVIGNGVNDATRTDAFTVLKNGNTTINGELTLVNGTNINEFSTDGTLVDDSDDAVPTEKAVKTYVDNAVIAPVWSKNAAHAYYTTGNVGIGTSTPAQDLHVAGDIRIDSALYDNNNSTGLVGQVLKSTGSGIVWDNLSATFIGGSGIDKSGNVFSVDLDAAGSGLELTGLVPNDYTLGIADAGVTNNMLAGAITDDKMFEDYIRTNEVDNASIEFAGGVLAIKSGGVTNAMLAGSITNAKLLNSYMNFTDGTNNENLELGESLRITGSGAANVNYDATTNTFTINAANTVYTAGDGIDLSGNTFSVDLDAAGSGLELTGIIPGDFTLGIADGGITNDMLAGNIADTKLSNDYIQTTEVDNSTIEFSGGTLNVVDGGISNIKIANAAVTENKLDKDYIQTTEVDNASIEFNGGTLNVVAGGITNAMLAGGVTNNKLVNDDITFGDGANTEGIALGESVNFIGSGLATVTYDNTTNTFTINGGTTTYTAGAGIDLTGNKFSSDIDPTGGLGYSGVGDARLIKIADNGIIDGMIALGTIADNKLATDYIQTTEVDNSSIEFVGGTLNVVNGGITNDMLAGNIANAKLINDNVTFGDGINTEDIALGSALTFTGTGLTTVTYNSVTNTFTIDGAPTTYTGGAGIDLTGSKFSVDLDGTGGLDFSGVGDNRKVKIANNGVTNAMIAVGTITDDRLNSDYIQTTEVDNSSIEFAGGSLNVVNGGITNAMLAGSITNAKLVNDNINFGDGTTNENIGLGEAVTITGSGLATVNYDNTTNTFTVTGNPTTYTAGAGIDLTGNKFSTDIDAAGGLAYSGAGDTRQLRIGVNSITDAMIAFGTIADNKLATDYIQTTEVDNSSIEFVGGTLNVKDNGIINSMILNGTIADAKMATDYVQTTEVDNSTIEFNLGTLNVKDAGITNAKLANNNITFGDGTSTEGIQLGQALTFTGSGAATVNYNNVTNTFTIDALNTTYTAGAGIDLTGTKFSSDLDPVGGLGFSGVGDARLLKIDDNGIIDGMIALGTINDNKLNSDYIQTTEVDNSTIEFTGGSLNIVNGGVTNAKLTNDNINFGDNINNEDIGLGDDVRFVGSGLTTVTYSSLTNTFTIDGAPTVYTGGAGIDLTGSKFSVDLDGAGGLDFSGAGDNRQVKIANNGVTNNMIAVGTITDDRLNNDYVQTTEVDNSSIEFSGGSLNVVAGGITNAMLAGNIANAKLVNDNINVGDGVTNEDIALGDAFAITGTGASTVTYDNTTNTFTVNSVNTTYTGGAGIDLTGTKFSVDLDGAGGLAFTGVGDTRQLSIGGNAITDAMIAFGTIADNKLSTDYIQTTEVDNSSIEFVGGTLNVAAGGITNAMLAGNIANAKLVNDNINFGDGVTNENISLGNGVTFTGSGAATVNYNNTTNTFTIDAVNTTYTAGAGVDLTGTKFSVDLDAAGGLDFTGVGDTRLLSIGTNAITNSMIAIGTIADDKMATDYIQTTEVDNSSIEFTGGNLNVKAGGVTNAMLAGGIVNSKLVNDGITLDDGTNSGQVDLGQTLNFTSSGVATVTYTPATRTLNIDAATNTYTASDPIQISAANNISLQYGAGLTLNGAGTLVLDGTAIDSEIEDDITDNYVPYNNGTKLVATNIYYSGTLVGIGTNTPARTLHVDDVMRLEPRANPPALPSEGDMYMNSTTHKLMVYDGTTWQACW